jgi:hypothetical protein
MTQQTAPRQTTIGPCDVGIVSVPKDSKTAKTGANQIAKIIRKPH